MGKIGDRTLTIIEEAEALFRERNARYQDSFARWGPIFAALFPNGITVDNAHDWNRLTTLGHIVDKLVRYTTDFHEPHADSVIDLGNYAFILAGLDAYKKDHT